MTRYLAIGLLSLLSLHCAVAQPPDPVNQTTSIKPVPRPGEPKDQIVEDINKFVNALNNKNPFEAMLYVKGARIGFFGANEWGLYWTTQLNVEKVQIDDIKGDDADVTVIYRKWPVPEGNTPELHDTLKLQRTTDPKDRFNNFIGYWRIVVQQPEIEFAKDMLSLNRLACIVKQYPGTIPYIRAEESLRRLKTLGLGSVQFLQDYDLVFAFDAPYVEEAITPYLTKDGVRFIIPGTNEKYAFNSALCDQNVNQFADPAHTVLFYEGHDQQLTFRYNGKAAVGFMDGHTALVTPEAAKALLWGH